MVQPLIYREIAKYINTQSKSSKSTKLTQVIKKEKKNMKVIKVIKVNTQIYLMPLKSDRPGCLVLKTTRRFGLWYLTLKLGKAFQTREG